MNRPKPMPDILNNIDSLVEESNKASVLSSGVVAALSLFTEITANVKFGHCPNAGAVETDVWEIGATQPVYIFPDASGESVTIESDNAADSQEITIQGLDENGLDKEEVVNLTGTTPVALPGLFTAVNRAFNSDSTVFIGDLSIKGSVSGNTFAYIDAREQQTTQCIYTVPSDKWAVVRNVSSSINDGGNQDTVSVVRLLAQRSGGVMRTQVRYGLQKRGTSNISSDLIIPAVYPPSTRLKMAMEPDAGPLDVSAELSIQLIDSDYLESIRE